MSNQKESRRSFFQKTVASSVGIIVAPSLIKGNTPESPSGIKIADVSPNWRNKQSGMVYRMLGRTGMMVSEIGMGTFPFTNEDVFPVLDTSIEKGINYIDCAAAYSKGLVETNLGNYFNKRGNREKIYLTTKLSGFSKGGYVKKIFDGLPEHKQNALREKADELMQERMVLRPGYHFHYFGGQEKQIHSWYLWHVVLQEYSLKEKDIKEIKTNAYGLLEDSLKRLQTDYVDVLFCPHGASAPELEDDIIKELFEEFKQKGMIRASAVSFHNDVAGNLSRVTELGYYDAAMFAYNIANHGSVDAVMHKAKQAGVGLIGMKLSRLFVMENQPEWIEEKMKTILPERNLSKFAKSYLWALQNPNLSCCVSQMENLEQLEDNTQVIGMNV